MSTPEPPSGPPAEAGAAPAPEPGHRARALAASLLGELTGQRRSGLTFAPLEPSGLSAEPTPEAPRPDQPRAEQSPADPASPPPVAPEDAAVETDPETVRVETVPEVPQVQPAETRAAEAPAAEAPAVEAPRLVADDAPRPAEQQGTGPLRAVPAPVGSTGPALRAVPDAPTPAAPVAAPAAPAAEAQPARPQAPAPERPAAPSTPPLASAALAPQQPAPSAPARSSEGGASAPSQEVRPAPFAYLAVAQHHTNPARATANGALDQAGQRISSRVDRALVRRAALVTMEAASLLDACDVLDGRARAADATWTGEHHSPTEVREFEGAWGAFYDAQGALASHVTG